MTVNPKRIIRSALAARALKLMEDHAITSLFVFDDEEGQEPVGILHLHDLLKAGIY
jgi:arabinose-5-phosphate isomerase